MTEHARFKSNFIFHDFLYKKQEKEKLSLFLYTGIFLLLSFSCIWAVIGFVYDIVSLTAVHSVICLVLGIVWICLKKGKINMAGHILSTIILFLIALIVVVFQGNHKMHPISVHHWLLVYIVGVQFVLIYEKKRYVFIHFLIGLIMFLCFEFRLIRFSPIIAVPSADMVSYIFTPLAILFSLILINSIFINRIITIERQFFKSNELLDILLKNLLPDEVVEKIIKEGRTFAEAFSECSVLFVKVIGLETLYDQEGHHEALSLLAKIFSKFDIQTEKYKAERIKTVGDLYMAVAGVPKIIEDHAVVVTKLALEFEQIIKEYEGLNIRVGINSGPVVAGLIGKNGLIYDLWGDTVNLASRMETHGVIGKIQISQETKEMIGKRFLIEEREKIRVKGKGLIGAYFVIGYKTIEKRKI